MFYLKLVPVHIFQQSTSKPAIFIFSTNYGLSSLWPTVHKRVSCPALFDQARALKAKYLTI